MASKTLQLGEAQKNAEAHILRETVSDLVDQNTTLQEGLDQVTAMFAREDMGWLKQFTSAEENGMSLAELKDWSGQIRNAQVGNPHIKRGLSLRRSYIWQGGIKYAGIKGAAQGRGVNVQKLIDQPMNQRNFFGQSARARREGCLYSDSIAFYIGNDKTKKLHSIPLAEITADLRDPDFDEDVWAYRRSWSYKPDGATPTMKHVWYFTDTFMEHRTKTVKFAGGREPEDVSQTHTIFDQVANSVDGFAYGSPDALAALVWSRIARDLTMDGVTMTHALATFAFKASRKAKPSGTTDSMQLGGSAPAGSTANLGSSNDLVPLSSAGKAYDFDGLRSVVAIIAASLDVSAISLTSDPGSAGAGTTSASTLDLPTRLAMEARRDEHVDFDRRVLLWMGAGDADVFFRAIIDPVDLYRAQQGVALEFGTGLYEAIEAKREFEALKGNDTTNIAVPDGVMLPNNTKTLEDEAKVADASAAKAAASASKLADKNAANGGDMASTQGSGAGVGPGVDANDMRTDTLTK